jgi:dTDP-4-dehydrorhamnose reductase
VALAGIPTAEFPTPAKRPANSRLDCTALEADFGIGAPDWRAGLDEVLRELGEVA